MCACVLEIQSHAHSREEEEEEERGNVSEQMRVGACVCVRDFVYAWKGRQEGRAGLAWQARATKRTDRQIIIDIHTRTHTSDIHRNARTASRHTQPTVCSSCIDLSRCVHICLLVRVQNDMH